MTPGDAAAVLAMAARWDQRKASRETCEAWALTLNGLALEDCLAAVRDHFRDPAEYLEAGMVRRRVLAIRLDRIERGKPFLTPPPELDALEGDAHTIGYARWEAGEHRKLADGADPRRLDEMRTLPPPEVRAALDALRKPPPAPDADTTEESA